MGPFPETEKKEEKWDIEAEHGPTSQVEFDTDEGTWMSCDVSPDGQWIVFDLLGDIYQMPIRGGKAELLSGGVSWESQPRFSPDGKWIAFTSDRDGLDNIWVMDNTGKNRRQITKETTRHMNSPAWIPNGQYLLARKHFVDTRSLGAGEIWMYYVDGGGMGVQLTEKTNWTANSGEPTVDSKGKRIFFAESPTPPPATPTAQTNIVSYLSSVMLSGDDYQRHLESRYAAEIVPSPDHLWVAFKELHKVYVAPFHQPGKMIKLSATENTVPVKKIADASGDWLSWAPDSKSVQWTLGERFYEQSIEDAFKEVSKDQKTADPKRTTIGINTTTFGKTRNYCASSREVGLTPDPGVEC